MERSDAAPKCYLSSSGGQWRVISQGIPVCKDMATRDAALRAATAVKATPTAWWDGDAGVMKPL